MRFANPEVFLLAPLVPFLLWWTLRPRHHAARGLQSLPSGEASAVPCGTFLLSKGFRSF